MGKRLIVERTANCPEDEWNFNYVDWDSALRQISELIENDYWSGIDDPSGYDWWFEDTEDDYA